MKCLMWITTIIMITVGLYLVGNAWINYNMDRNVWERTRNTILNDEVTPNYIDEGKVFKMNGNVFIRIRDEVYLLKTYK